MGIQHAEKIVGEANALEALAQTFAPGMAEVNRLIIERMDSHVPLIKQLATYLIASGGKRVRPLLTLACADLYGGAPARAHMLAACVEFIHTATLLHDDVVDGSDERRGQTSAHLVFGNQASVLVGDFLFSRAFQLMVRDGSLEVLRILSDASAVIAEGEVLQLAQAGNVDLTIDTYIDIVKGKTAALFSAACEVAPVIAEAGPEQQALMREFGTDLGIAFQIADDVLDYSAEREKLGKTIGDDFREGKITAPVLFALQEADEEEKHFWISMMSEREQKQGDFLHAMQILEKHDALNKGMALADSYAEKARLALLKTPDNATRDRLFDLLKFIINRDY